MWSLKQPMRSVQNAVNSGTVLGKPGKSLSRAMDVVVKRCRHNAVCSSPSKNTLETGGVRIAHLHILKSFFPGWRAIGFLGTPLHLRQFQTGQHFCLAPMQTEASRTPSEEGPRTSEALSHDERGKSEDSQYDGEALGGSMQAAKIYIEGDNAVSGATILGISSVRTTLSSITYSM